MSSASPAADSQGRTTSSPGNPDAHHVQVHAHACVTCAQRKVKCDRLQPCSNCERTKTDCEYRDPAPPKRRKRKQPLDEETLAKLERYEKLLTQFGVDIESPNGSNGNARSPADQLPAASSRQGSTHSWKPAVTQTSWNGRKYAAIGRPGVDEKLIIDGNKSRYLENNLWASLSEDIDYLKEENPNRYDTHDTKHSTDRALQIRDRGPSTLLFGNNQLLSQDELLKLHPQVENIRKMWAIFRDNVDPLVKLFDINVKEAMFLKTAPLQADGTFRFAEAFFFSVYFCAVTSLDDDECLKAFDETRAVLLDRYQMGTEQALINANLLNTSDMFVLQALILYLIGIRQRADAGAVWILTGVVIRMAQRGGLHRDAENIDGNVWPWNAELRRRGWWQIMMLDGRISELSGLGHSVWASFRWDTKQPLNINDSDLDSSATEYPPERIGATDMIFCSIVYEVGTAFRTLLGPITSTGPSEVAEDEARVDELEKTVENKYLRYCDPLIPLHSLCSIMTRASLASMRFKLNHPRCRSNKGRAASQVQKDRSFSLALKVLEYYNLAYSTKSLKRFWWHIRSHFPWAQCVFLISELQHRTKGPDVDHAWKQLEEILSHHPEILQDKTKSIHVAFAYFTLRVWDARAKELQLETSEVPDPMAPIFIQLLQKDRLARQTEHSHSQSKSQGEPFPNQPTHIQPDNVTLRTEGQPLHPMVQDIPFPTMAYNSDLGMNSNHYSWPQWDDLIFQDYNFPGGLPLALDDQANSFGITQ